MSDFAVTVAVCAHRDVKVGVWDTLWNLKKCPNPDINVRIQDGDALISRSRSRVATYFLEKTKDELLMFLDDDVVISTFDATKLMWAAKQLKLDVIGAAYATKSKENPGLAIRPLSYGGKMKFGKEGQIEEVASISSGCMVIRRAVLQELVNSKTIPLCRHGSHEYYPFFQHRAMKIDGVWEDMSEDWFFCEMARSIGFKVYMDTTIKTEHIGPYAFTWDDVYEKNIGIRKTYDNVQFTLGLNDKQPISVNGLKKAELQNAVKGEHHG